MPKSDRPRLTSAGIASGVPDGASTADWMPQQNANRALTDSLCANAISGSGDRCRASRIAVSPDKMNDAEAQQLARDIARKVKQEMTYPGQIKVMVIRETRAVETAK